MRLATLRTAAGPRAAVAVADGTFVAARDLVAGAPDDMVELIAAWPDLHARIAAAAAQRHGGAPPNTAALLAPIPRPRRNVFCVGWNYSEHFAEGARLRTQQGSAGAQEIPEYPALFSKNPATVTGPDAAIWWPAPYSEQLDWECELAVVIGTGGRDIAEERAGEHVFGYTCANDVSVRDVQRRHGGQWFKGKNFDSHLPLGPWIVTADELDASAVGIRTRVNGVTKQDSNTRFMVFKVPRLVSELSSGATLEPGDIVITGTPEGVGFARKPPEFLQVGDTVEVEIDGIGVLRNTVRRRTA